MILLDIIIYNYILYHKMKLNQKDLPAKIPRLMIYNPKGGVGKTALALNFALSFGYGIITNDRLSIVDQVLPSQRYMILKQNQSLPDIAEDWPIIFDFGGYPDQRARSALKISQFLIIPVLPHKENIQTSLNFIQEIKSYKTEKEIMIVVNQTAGRQYEEVKRAVKHFYPQIAVLNLKKSAVFAWLTEQKKSVTELVKLNKLQARHFAPVAEQFNKMTAYMLDQSRFFQTSFQEK